MSSSPDDPRPSTYSDALDRRGRPVVGLLAAPAGRDATLRSVLRSHERGFDVVIGSVEQIDDETEQLLRQPALNVEFVTAADRAELRRRLSEFCDDRQYPGLIYHDPTKRMDFEESCKKLHAAATTTIDSETEESDRGPSRLVGIPAYNESVGIGSTVIATANHADEVVVVDDGSTDGTGSIARQSGATVLEHEENRGKGAALRTFFEYARMTDYDEIVVIDGDGQHVPEQIPHVSEPITRDDADVVIGSRYLEGDRTETPRYRRFGQWVLDTLTLLSSEQSLTDTQCGFRAFSPKVIEDVEIRTDGIGVESELTRVTIEEGFDIVERPIDVRYEGIDGQTHNPVYHGVNVVGLLLKDIGRQRPWLVAGTAVTAAVSVGAMYFLNVSELSGELYDHGAFEAALVVGLVLTGLAGLLNGPRRTRFSNVLGLRAGEDDPMEGSR